MFDTHPFLGGNEAADKVNRKPAGYTAGVMNDRDPGRISSGD